MINNGDKTIYILTLAMDQEAQHYFDELRQLYFPRQRNFLKAHLTLFHNLPAIQPLSFTPFDMQATHVVSIGNGVAIKIESPELQQLHARLQQQFKEHLIPQDRQKLWPHITIQNKVSADVVQQTMVTVAAGFKPFKFRVTGLHWWIYENGPWQFVETVA